MTGEPINLTALRATITTGGYVNSKEFCTTVLALIDAVEVARAFEQMASYDFYPDERVQARMDLREALERFTP